MASLSHTLFHLGTFTFLLSQFDIISIASENNYYWKSVSCGDYIFFLLLPYVYLYVHHIQKLCSTPSLVRDIASAFLQIHCGALIWVNWWGPTRLLKGNLCFSLLPRSTALRHIYVYKVHTALDPGGPPFCICVELSVG